MRISEMLTLVGSELKLNKSDAYFDFTLAHSFPIDAATQIKTGISVVIETQSADNPKLQNSITTRWLTSGRARIFIVVTPTSFNLHRINYEFLLWY